MRLSILDNGHRRRAKLFLALTSRRSKVDSPDIVKMLLYRPGFLSRPLLELTAAAMRGPSYWTAGEREYLAMSTAQVHECPFCAVTHAELTRIAGTGEIDPGDPASARPELAAARAFLESVSRDPAHVDAAVVAGLPRRAILDALRVNLVWNIVNRLANAFGFVLREGQLETGTRSLHRFGYRFPRFLIAEGPRTELADAAARLGDGLPEDLRAYARTVRDASHRITDADVQALRSAGHSEDEIFEVTIAAAVDAALAAFEAGRRATGA
ncbi:hypothetical protein ACFVYA_02935 [Amycolatopsis sp. NPDC058278]|uniref:carboxymuconolactone decarboxylase family protein n=1 Tax=Amycolatopsis sp. NPDC058278 TaxID=3346417 RepID=UPI0036D7C7D0